MTLVEFLLARIAEDEADAMTGWRWKSLPAGEYERLQARLLAECESKRRIVELHRRNVEVDDCWSCGWVNPWPCRTMRALALPYADHPDYDETWASLTRRNAEA